MARQPLFRRRDRGDLGTYRVANVFLAAREGLREAGQHAPRKPREHAVGEAGRTVLLVHDQRRAAQPGGEAAGAGRVTAETDHRAWPARTQHAPGGDHRPRDPQGRRGQRREALPAQATNGNGVQRDALFRHQARFHLPVRTQPGDRHAARVQCGGHGQAGEDMPTGAAGKDHDGAVEARAAVHPGLPKTGSTRCRGRGLLRTLPPADPDVGAAAGAVPVAAVLAVAGACASPRRRATWRCARSSS
mgnify:CR=1 FL=1